MNNELAVLANAANAVANDKLEMLKVTDESLQPIGAPPATPRFTQEQLHNALSDIIDTPTQVSYLYMSGKDITDLVCQYPNNSIACLYGDTAMSISSRNRIMSTIVYGVGRSMVIGYDVTLSDILLLSIDTMSTLAETAEIGKCITAALQCLEDNAPNSDTHIGGPVE